MTELENLWKQLQNPEYLHLVLEPLTWAGLLLCTLFAILTTAFKDRRGGNVALFGLTLCAGSTWFYLATLKQALPRLLALADAQSQKLLQAHADLVERWLWAYLGCAALALLTLFLRFKPSKPGNILFALTLLASLALAILGLWIHSQGALADHPNLRSL